MTTRAYVIIDVVDITDHILEQSLNTADSFRTSINGKKAVLKFDSNYPDHLGGYTKYTSDELVVLLSGVGWTETES